VAPHRVELSFQRVIFARPPRQIRDLIASTRTQRDDVHFKKLGVPRDLSAKIHAKADAMVAEAMVTGKVSTETTKRDAEIIDGGATLVATVLLSQRADITKARGLVTKLMAELEAQTDCGDLFKELGEALRDPEANDKRMALFEKQLSTPHDPGLRPQARRPSGQVRQEKGADHPGTIATRDGGSPLNPITYDSDAQEEVLFAVKNRGPMIERSSLIQIFDPLKRGPEHQDSARVPFRFSPTGSSSPWITSTGRSFGMRASRAGSRRRAKPTKTSRTSSLLKAKPASGSLVYLLTSAASRLSHSKPG
jgi:hypothetical protein